MRRMIVVPTDANLDFGHEKTASRDGRILP